MPSPVALPAIAPMPPLAAGIALPWDVAVADPVATLSAARTEFGDTFVVDSGEDRYLFTFSPRGVESFYALPEELASKGLADYRMLRRKLPDEIFADRRTLPSQLFRRDDVAAYLTNLSRALDMSGDELGDHGDAEVFALTRRLAHRMGLASWAGPGCADGPRLERLIAALDDLDGSAAFVHPDAMKLVAANGKAAERAALEEIVEVIGAVIDEPTPDHPLFARIVDEWADEPAADRRRGVALDVALIHIASMSNLAAALGWVLIDLIAHPADCARVSEGDVALAEQCALESTRLAQRSIMPRYVLADLDFDVEDATFSVAPGITIATLLPLTNTSAGPGLEHWDPRRWNRHRLVEPSELASVQLVTAFGHGRHSCPAQPFSLSAMAMTATRLFGAYELTPRWDTAPAALPGQIGGVARAAGPAPVSYRRR
ncbi:cytochrome [Mycolicibacterium sp.]|uniref:cytochrome n=1 Tax=Mycolicibacterium sp. TaxID=2320850 RepID=UPI001A23308D|nr:cytochrome [Mycolicibacterium sp.]MBJ7399297.1 cytochrome [Mycolicibacterium sp.]